MAIEKPYKYMAEFRGFGRVSLIAGMEYVMERWNGKWNGTVNVYSYS